MIDSDVLRGTIGFMNWMESVGFQILESFQYRNPGPIALEKMSGWTDRIFQMDKLKKGIDGLCAWCNVVPAPDKRRKYCDHNCRESAYHYCYPQSVNAKAARLILLQDCVCAICGLDYSEDIYLKALEKYKSNLKGMSSQWCDYKDPEVSFWQICFNTGDVWQVDHITPVFKGGKGIGFDNVQVVCKSCHILKSIEERR